MELYGRWTTFGLGRGFCAVMFAGLAAGCCGATGGGGGDAGAAGANDAGSSGDAGQTASEASCETFRDEAGAAETVVMVLNERGGPVYLQPPRRCGNSPPRLVSFDRPVLFPDALQACGVTSCQQLQEGGYVEPSPCAGDCETPELVRLDPGAALVAGRFRSEERAHGPAASGLPRMPDDCFSGRDPQLTPGAECSSETPMVGSYVVTARAFATLDCDADAELCDCVSNAEGTCVTGVSSGSGEASTSATFDAGVVRVDLVFR